MSKKNIQYLNRDFSSFKTSLINFAKDYYPETYNDFSEASPGMMFIDMAAYVGDILSLYQDNQILETFPQFSNQKSNLLAHSYLNAYRPQVTSVSNVLIDIYQIIPSTVSQSFNVPNYNYALILDEGTQLQSSNNPNNKFIIEDVIDFSKSSSYDPTDVSIYSIDGNSNPEYYLLKKQRKAYSGNIKTVTYNFDSPQKFKTITIDDSRIIKILEVTDSNNENWYEVPYLAQSTIFNKLSTKKNPNFSQFQDSTPYILQLKSVPKRFVSRFKNNTTLEIQFGAGILDESDEEVIPNFDNIGLGLPYGVDKMTTAFDPSNFLYTKSYGLAPSNTTLTIKYLVGGGVESNAASNSINTLHSGSINFSGITNPGLENTIINSLSFDNENPAIGGGDGDSIEDLRLKIQSSYPTQLRAVTKDDYIIRSLSLPPEFGLVSKCFLLKESFERDTLSLFILTKDGEGSLSVSNRLIKENLKTYLEEFRMDTDSLNIKDAFIINIGVEFDITIRPDANAKIVLNKCLQEVKKYFNIDRWNINQPIILSEIYNLIDKIDGVQTVKKVNITNKSGEDLKYSKYGYDIKGATFNGVIFPSLDPSIFELKFPDIDIQGRNVSF